MSEEAEDIFFRPSTSNEESSTNDSFNDDLPPRIILVCFLCFREYDLEEDLRGHMIEYHKFNLKEEPEQKMTKRETKEEPTPEENVEQVEKQASEVKEEIDKPLIDNEMKPVPFKDFRLILRSEMSLKCNKYSNCIYKFETPEKLKQHMDCHAANKSTFQCYICSVGLSNWRRCSAHLWKMHQLDVDLLKCPICGFKSHASALVWRHMRVHKKWRPRVLRSLKAVKQRRLEALKQNEETIEPATPKPPTPRKNKYYSEKTCEICERKFVNGKTLSKHIKTVHNKIKPFNCNVCGKKTARKASLIIHMRQHTGEKPLACKSCKFSTRDPSVLHKHQMRHELAGKLKCSLCDYSCIQSNALKRHIRLNHVEYYKEISCDLCSFVTINVNKLKAHKEDHRKGLIVNNEDSMPARKLVKNNEVSTDCFLPLESIDSLPHEPAVDTGGVTIPAPSEDSQFPTYLNN
ncbi:PR domain zinc finger protein 5 [Lucilia sericata]|uniref:PR domain zinc finger protein 5 n=1 Tax=Lucilia sericata TaxID=13632 RepID=UPI0018A824B2|nr:PR domain zinc finger protein 5 [Lucilia sericata]